MSNESWARAIEEMNEKHRLEMVESIISRIHKASYEKVDIIERILDL